MSMKNISKALFSLGARARALRPAVFTEVPEHSARVRFSLGTNVNAPFYQVSTPEFGNSVRARVQGRDLVFRRQSRHRLPVCALLYFVPDPDGSARAPSVNIT